VGLIEELLSEYELLDGRIRAGAPRYAGLPRPGEVKLPEVQHLLDQTPRASPGTASSACTKSIISA